MGKIKQTHKDQHFIPQSYLKPWADPSAPAEYEPYVHIFSKDGTEHSRKAPKNIFSETDLYTLKMPDGGRDLRLEQGLSGLEKRFSMLRKEFLEPRRQLPLVRRTKLMLFMAAMHNRTPSRIEWLQNPWRDVQRMGREMEEYMEKASPAERKAAASMSLPSRGPSITMDQVDEALEEAVKHLMIPSIEAEFPLLLRMQAIVLCARENAGFFITSDHPVSYFDPQAYKRPPMFRSPAFCYESLEITLPLSPTQTLYLKHGDTAVIAYIDVDEKVVRELNRRTCFNCDKTFVVRDGRIDPYWFDAGQRPKDSWEETQAEAVE